MAKDHKHLTLHTFRSTKLATLLAVSLSGILITQVEAKVALTAGTSDSGKSSGHSVSSSLVRRAGLDRGNGLLGKRYSNSRFTYYEPGLGACGWHNSANDFIVAIAGHNWDSGSHCGKSIDIMANGKATRAAVVDMCPGCPEGGLDLSPGLFSFLASLNQGVVYGSWWFVDGRGNEYPSREWKSAVGSAEEPLHQEEDLTTSQWMNSSTLVQMTSTLTPSDMETSTSGPTETKTKAWGTATRTWSSSLTQISTISVEPTTIPSETGMLDPDESQSQGHACSPDVLQDLNVALLDLGALVVKAATVGTEH